jgi:purine-nucleoside phosphorylase
MGRFTSMMDVTAADWLRALELPEADIPDLVVVEGSWWHHQRARWRLSYLAEVHELKFPDIFWGRWHGKRVAYCCAYGAARAAEVVHLFGVLGSKLAVQIGTCGGLQRHLKPGDVVLPRVAICREGVAHIYGCFDAAPAAGEWVKRAEWLLDRHGRQTHTGTHMTWASLFGQTGRMVDGWHQAGYLAVDMETAATLAVASYFGMPALSMLVVWDDLTRQCTFLDPLSEAEQAAFNRSNGAIFEVALELANQL